MLARCFALFAAFAMLASSISIHELAGQTKAHEIRGTVRDVDADNGTITIILPTKLAGRIKTYSLFKKDLPVTNARGDKLTLDDVKVDGHVTLRLGNDDDVMAIETALPMVNGMVLDVKLGKRRLDIKSAFGPREFVVPIDAKILVDGSPATLDQLKTGKNVQLTFTPDGKSILEVRSSKATTIKSPFSTLSKHIATIIEVDAEKKNVSVLMKTFQGDYWALRQVSIAPDATFELFYKLKPAFEMPREHLSRGALSTIWVDFGTGKVMHLAAEMPILVSRKIKAIDGERVTFDDEDKERSLPFAAEVRTQKRGVKVTLADVRPGSDVHLGLSLDRARVMFIDIADK